MTTSIFLRRKSLHVHCTPIIGINVKHKLVAFPHSLLKESTLATPERYPHTCTWANFLHITNNNVPMHLNGTSRSAPYRRSALATLPYPHYQFRSTAIYERYHKHSSIQKWEYLVNIDCIKQSHKVVAFICILIKGIRLDDN